VHGLQLLDDYLAMVNLGPIMPADSDEECVMARNRLRPLQMLTSSFRNGGSERSDPDSAAVI
jgi:hypothetical protein